MKMFYSANTGGFYDPDFSGSVPQDAVEITGERHAELLDGQAAGQMIVPDQNGYPVLAARPAQSSEAQAAIARGERNKRLSACDWTQLTDAPLTEQQKAAWTTYRQALRDVPDQQGFPSSIDWPASP